MDQEVRELFREAVNRPQQQRAEWLRESCPDTQIRAEVISLLFHDRDSDATLNRRVQAVAEQVDLLNRFEPGLRVGVFELGRLLGRGGMGCVFEAHRVDEHIRQTVAIKFLDLPIADESFHNAAAGRFLQERRILATLQHPYIASLIDAGTINDIPYFVMERVEGVPIDQYAVTHQLDVRACLELVLKVSEAVERAHQNLIVHQDIKPSNILVTEDGTPKLLDFGIAKELFNVAGTRTFAPALTPEYASPEQLSGGPVMVATDVHGLGGLLYRLLTGMPPHPIRGSSPAQWVRIILEEDVVPATTFRPELRGDLDNILRKALHRDPNRRYESARAFAEDLQRFLNSRTVRATPDSFVYRARTLLRRNKLLTAVTALAAASLLGGTVVSVHLARQAEHRFDQVRQLANVFLFDFERSIRDTPGTLEARNLVASTGQRYLKQLASESRNDKSLQRDIAEAYERLADIQGALQSGRGKAPGETDSLLQSLEIKRRLGDDRSSVPSLRRKYIELASLLGYQFQDAKNTTGAAKWADEAMRLSEEWVKAEPQSVHALSAATTAFLRGGTTQEVGGEFSRAQQTLEKSVAFADRTLTLSPNDEGIRTLASGAERTFSELLQTAKRYQEALAHGKRALALVEPLWKEHPDDRRLRTTFINATSAVGIAERSLGETDPPRLQAALPYLQRAYHLSNESMLADPKNARNKVNFVVACHRLCSLLNEMKKYDEAIVLYNASDKASRELALLDPTNRRGWYLVGKNQLDLGWLLLSAHRTAEANRAFLAVDEGFDRALQMDPQDTVILECRTGQLEGLARAASLAGDAPEARRWMIRCLDVMRRMVSRDAGLKDYIYDYSGKLEFARKLNLSTEGLN